MTKSKIAVLGSTGSIGTQTLDIVRENPDCFEVIALSADTNIELLTQQVLEFKPKVVRVKDEILVSLLNEKIASTNTKVVSGDSGLLEISQIPEIETIMVSIIGYAAFPVIVSAIENGKNIALANKESLIVGGSVIRGLSAKHSINLVPVDSEHNSIYQCLKARPNEVPYRVMITASGGPFLNHSKEQLSNVTPEQAVKHPKWSMGAKISVDSATLMNKGLEVIEALELFSFPLEKMQVIVHPQHVIHAMVEYGDGSTVALMYDPDMRIPITHALFSCSKHHSTSFFQNKKPMRKMLDFSEISKLDFSLPDEDKFPCLGLAKEAFQKGGDSKIILNWANEVAVDLFLNRKIKFIEIPKIISCSIEQSDSKVELKTIEDVVNAQTRAREVVMQITNQLNLG